MRSSYAYVLVVFLVCGCSSRIPQPITYQYSQQKKMQAVSHWDVLAADLANRINKKLIVTDNIYKAVFVKETCGNEIKSCKPNETSSFNESFRDLLITNLFGLGIPTKSRPNEAAIEIDYKVQVVRHLTDRVRSLQPGLLTGLSAAITVLRNAPVELALLATGIAADVANTSLVVNGHYEVIITTSMVADDRYLFRVSDIYYINDKDFYHYQNNMPQAKTIKLSNGKTQKQTESSGLLLIKQIPIEPQEQTKNLESLIVEEPHPLSDYHYQNNKPQHKTIRFSSNKTIKQTNTAQLLPKKFPLKASQQRVETLEPWSIEEPQPLNLSDIERFK